jgi:hypothetical protein
LLFVVLPPSVEVMARSAVEPSQHHGVGSAPTDTVHAMTIHKSQGSQCEAVAVVLPEPSSPILTREHSAHQGTAARLASEPTQGQSHARGRSSSQRGFTVRSSSGAFRLAEGQRLSGR